MLPEKRAALAKNEFSLELIIGFVICLHKENWWLACVLKVCSALFLLGQLQSCWKHEYLTSLREHHRATGINSQKIKTVNIVLVHDDTPRITWKLAVIEELMKGKDGLVCAAKIRTAQGEPTVLLPG